MRRRWLVLLIGLIVVASGVVAVANGPLMMARGRFSARVHFAGMALEMRVGLNVQDHGPNGADQGKLSVRVYEMYTGDLLAVLASSDVRDVMPWIDGMVFTADMQVVFGFLPIPGTFEIRLVDAPGGDMIALFGLWMDVERGYLIIQ